MKKTVVATMALSLTLPLATPAFAQPHRNDDRRGPSAHANVRADRNHGASVRAKAHGNPFRKGQRFVSSRAPNYRVVDYRQYRRLGPPPRGYHWVRSGNDALLVAISSGIIASVIANNF
ncbi:RcnB family protein [Novosphingobium olei]|uniref:Ni/Co efflux regulator RcnB n=1 Tax=Novosphingobium olei TaxID=2728851 RepID=A0A7Y0BQT8_9SPHN|nr:RcnB family protein [Novosphingobium olei]NML94758.1 hypothetical protein [Novosphingobium olei]